MNYNLSYELYVQINENDTEQIILNMLGDENDGIFKVIIDIDNHEQNTLSIEIIPYLTDYINLNKTNPELHIKNVEKIYKYVQELGKLSFVTEAEFLINTKDNGVVKWDFYENSSLDNNNFKSFIIDINSNAFFKYRGE